MSCKWANKFVNDVSDLSGTPFLRYLLETSCNNFFYFHIFSFSGFLTFLIYTYFTNITASVTAYVNVKNCVTHIVFKNSL